MIVSKRQFNNKEVDDEQSHLSQPCWLNRNVSRVLDQLKIKDGVNQKLKINAQRILESLLYTFVCRMRKAYPIGKEYVRFLRSAQWIMDILLNVQSITQQFDLTKYFTQRLVFLRVKSERDPPKRPDFVDEGLVFFKGFMRRFVSTAEARGDFTIHLSLDAAKRYWNKPMLEKVAGTLAGHHTKLSTISTVPVPVVILEEIRNVVSELVSTPVIASNFTPSQSACLQAGRLNNGNLSLFPRFDLDAESVMETLRSPPGFEGRATRTFPLLPQILMFHFNEHRLNSHNAVRSSARLGGIDNVIKVVFLYEPGGKVRILGVEDGYYSSYIQPIQGMMLDWWKSDPSTTMVADLDTEIIELFSDEFSRTQSHFCSGDYSSATDDLKKEASAAGHSAIFEAAQIDDDIMSIIEHTEEFVGGNLIYPEKIVDDKPIDGGPKEERALELDPICQENGQRMGNRKSFVVLCVINKAVYRAAVRIYLAKRSDLTEHEKLLQKLQYFKHVKVNGDDILFKCNPELFDIWRQCVIDVGWTPSPGKNYLCKGFAQINSRNYILKNNKLTRVGYLNLKLVTGFSLKSGESEADPETLGTNLNEMVRFCPWSSPSIPKCLIRFNNRYRGKFKPNWYLPAHLGGFGINADLDEGTEIGISIEQRKVASLLLTNRREHLTKKIEYGEVRWEKMHKKLLAFQPPVHFAQIDEYVDPSIYTEDFSASTGRLTLIHQWSNAGQSQSKTEKKIYLRWFNKWQSRKPISINKLFKYWEPRQYCMKVEEMPSLSEIGPWRCRKDRKATVEDFPDACAFLHMLSNRSEELELGSKAYSYLSTSDTVWKFESWLEDKSEILSKFAPKGLVSDDQRLQLDVALESDTVRERADGFINYVWDVFGVRNYTSDTLPLDYIRHKRMMHMLAGPTMFSRRRAFYSHGMGPEPEPPEAVLPSIERLLNIYDGVAQAGPYGNDYFLECTGGGFFTPSIAHVPIPSDEPIMPLSENIWPTTVDEFDEFVAHNV